MPVVLKLAHKSLSISLPPMPLPTTYFILYAFYSSTSRPAAAAAADQAPSGAHTLAVLLFFGQSVKNDTHIGHSGTDGRNIEV